MTYTLQFKYKPGDRVRWISSSNWFHGVCKVIRIFEDPDGRGYMAATERQTEFFLADEFEPNTELISSTPGYQGTRQ